MSNLMNNVSTTLGLTKDPVKYEQAALAYEQKGNLAKATKNREKAQRLRQAQLTGQPITFNPLKDPERYDQKAIKWQNKGNMQKAQLNRDKAARLRAELATTAANRNNAAMGTMPTYAPLGTNTLGTNTMGTYAPIGTNTMGTTHTVVAPPVVQNVTLPTVIEQTARPERIVEVQPVVHREIDQPQVHLVERHSYESVASTAPAVINCTPIVEETIRPRVIEEVQPVVHRSVPAPFIEHVEQHTTERIVQPTVVTKEVLNNTQVTSVPAVAAGGIPPTSTNTAAPAARRL